MSSRFSKLSLLLLLICLLTFSAGASASGMNIIEFDFEEFNTGDVVTSYSKGGVTITVATTPTDAVVFDSSAPTCGDPDLGSPNQDFGGPGRGEGGRAGMPGANFKSLGKVLVIQQQNDPCIPNDNSGGGEITFTFSEDVTVNYFELLDIELDEVGMVLELFDANGDPLGTLNADGLGNNSYEEFMVNISGVRSMIATLAGSGAIPGVIVSTDVTAGLGDYVWHDEDQDGIQDELPATHGLNGITVNLLDESGNFLQSTVTANDPDGNPGFYQFLGLTPDTYIVEFIATDDYNNFTTPFNSAPFSDSNADVVTGWTPPVTLDAGEYDPTIDAGLYSDPTAINLQYLDVRAAVPAALWLLPAVILLAAATLLVWRKRA